MSDTLERVRKIVIEQLDADPDKVTEKASFIDDLGADSLDTVELVMAFEEEFDVEIPDDAAEHIQTVGDAKVLEQIEKQLHKLVDVLRVSELGQGAYVEREVMLVKIQASGYGREEVKRNTDIFRGQIIDVTPSIYTVQLAGTSDKLDAFLASVRDVAKIVEVARSGIVGLSRGEKIMR